MDTNERIDIFYDYSAILSRLRAYAIWIFFSEELDTILETLRRCTAARIKCSINTLYVEVISLGNCKPVLLVRVSVEPGTSLRSYRYPYFCTGLDLENRRDVRK